ncbi:MAG: aminotransferase class I/II-fold pyridoxal phosphate-dependent enzyme [Bacteroidia bacterium]
MIFNQSQNAKTNSCLRFAYVNQIPFHIPYKTKESFGSIDPEQLETSFYHSKLRQYFEAMGYQNHFLVDSCTRALEIGVYCLKLERHDEVIVPAYGYVSTANVFAKVGAKLIFADSQENHPNISIESVESLINSNTKAVVAIHYGGYSNEIAELRKLCDAHNLILIEDNAHGIGAKHGEKYLGTFGHLSALSFHETKNIHCFTGGLLAVNDQRFLTKATEYFYKGTNRADFKRGDVPYYEWTGNGNSCEMNVMANAFLAQQIDLLPEVNQKRLKIWNTYQKAFEGKDWNIIADEIAHSQIQGHSGLDPESFGLNQQTLNQVQGDVNMVQHNAHIYPICFGSESERLKAEGILKAKGIAAYTHYHSLNRTKFGKQFGEFETPNADKFTKGLLRLPIYPDLDFERVIDALNKV